MACLDWLCVPMRTTGFDITKRLQLWAHFWSKHKNSAGTFIIICGGGRERMETKRHPWDAHFSKGVLVLFNPVN